MSEYIELSTITPSSSEESVFNRPSTSSGIRNRGGYTSIPIGSSSSSISSAGSDSKFRRPQVPSLGSAVFAAGSQYQPIFEGQLGAAAADPDNPFLKWVYRDRDKGRQEAQTILEREVNSGNILPAAKIKPANLSWNKQTRKQYPEHWKSVRLLQKAKNTKKQVPEQKSNGLVLPFSNNIGPGNPIRPPTNRADLIAQGHDLHYQQAKKNQDVLSADREAISQFAHEAVQGSDPISRIHATVGAIGLGAKHAVESLSGKVFYGTPQEVQQEEEEDGIDDFLDQVRQNQAGSSSMSSVPSEVSSSMGGVKRGNTANSGSKPAKVAKSGTSLPGTGGNLDGMTSGGAGGSDEGPGILRPIGIHVDKMIKVYHKKWRFLTSANANIILAEAASGDVPARYALTTGMASIPWEYLFFYMSPAEYSRMQNYPGTFAKSCSIKITPWNTRVAFQTGDTQTANATLNQNKFLQVAKGLRSIPYIASSNRRYAYSSTEPMQPTGFTTQNSIAYREGLQLSMYGYDNSTASATFIQRPPADATGAEIYLQDYLTIYTHASNNVNYQAGFPPYKNFIEELDANACINRAVVDMNYNFDYAPLTPQFAAVANSLITNSAALTLSSGTKLETTGKKFVIYNQTDAPIQSFDNERTFLQGPNGNPLYFTENQVYSRYPMEQSGVFEELNRQSVGDAQQPSINIGIRAVPKLTTLDNTVQANSWLDAQGYFEVEATLVTESVDPYTYIRGGCFSANTKGQMQYTTSSTSRPQAHTYDIPNVYGRMPIRDTIAPT